jgi:protein SCO1/2
MALVVGGVCGAHDHEPARTAPGVEEHLGRAVPLEARFTREDGREVALGELVSKPTILALVFYRCPNACGLVLDGLAEAVRTLDAVPGVDYRIVTATINDRETPADAGEAKRRAIAAVQEPFPAEAWTFLTGGRDSIVDLADAVGFRFVARGDEFDHPMGLVVLSPEGTIVRYVMGTDYHPVELRMAILEASTGTIGPTISKVLRFCLRYDPERRTFVLASLRVTATATLTIAGLLVLYLALSGRKRRSAGGG